jgi:large subunit ribosomal protein L23
MAIFDIFKKKQETERSQKKEAGAYKKRERKTPAVRAKKPKVKKEKKEPVKAEVAAKKEETPAKPIVSKKKIKGLSYGILKFPHITEKATNLSESNKYVFKVWQRANKAEIKKAIESNYGVTVVKVNIINIKGKEIMLGRQIGMKKGYKKAIVKVAQGQKIEILSR